MLVSVKTQRLGWLHLFDRSPIDYQYWSTVKRIKSLSLLITMNSVLDMFNVNLLTISHWQIFVLLMSLSPYVRLVLLANNLARLLTTFIWHLNQIQKSIMVYKSINGLAPEYLCSKFGERSCVSGYSLRDTTGKLAVPIPCTNYLKNSFSYSGAVIPYHTIPYHTILYQTIPCRIVPYHTIPYYNIPLIKNVSSILWSSFVHMIKW